LDGEHAMELARFRSGYPMQDLDRIKVQQDIIKAIAKELFIHSPSFYNWTFNNISTDLSNSDIIQLITWFIQNKPQLTSSTIQGTCQYINGVSYFIAK
jgi:anionic cell wall polymer biosynthesis LytR-Cps2A-Psr (LCP) family protein